MGDETEARSDRSRTSDRSKSPARRNRAIHQALRRVAASRLGWAAAVLLLVYTLGGFILAPYLIERYLPRYALQHLGQRATVNAVRINPFLLTVEASGFQLEGSGDSSMLAFKRLWVQWH